MPEPSPCLPVLFLVGGYARAKLNAFGPEESRCDRLACVGSDLLSPGRTHSLDDHDHQRLPDDRRENHLVDCRLGHSSGRSFPVPAGGAAAQPSLWWPLALPAAVVRSIRYNVHGAWDDSTSQAPCSVQFLSIRLQALCVDLRAL